MIFKNFYRINDNLTLKKGFMFAKTLQWIKTLEHSIKTSSETLQNN